MNEKEGVSKAVGHPLSRYINLFASFVNIVSCSSPESDGPFELK